ncbi:30S ribosomal protein S6 [Candidatus Daviesbacteria bacterium]|nr:30S ribosomal protein S6 [Candidatus Daviesbacteria bacterium]
MKSKLKNATLAPVNQYALTLVLKPDLDEKVRQELLAGVAKNFDKLDKQDEWGARDLAFPIRKQNKGYYVHFEFGASPDKIKPLDKSLKVEEDIIRYLLIRV